MSLWHRHGIAARRAVALPWYTMARLWNTERTTTHDTPQRRHGRVMVLRGNAMVADGNDTVADSNAVAVP